MCVDNGAEATGKGMCNKRINEEMEEKELSIRAVRNSDRLQEKELRAGRKCANTHTEIKLLNSFHSRQALETDSIKVTLV